MGLKKLTGKDYFALLCDCSAYGDKDCLISGVYATKKEAQEANKEIKDCLARHIIKRVKKITLELYAR